MEKIPSSPSQTPNPDHALEARLVAMLLGEASDFEKAELEEEIADRPELQAFLEEIRSVHELNQFALAASKQSTDEEPWHLPKDKRAILLAQIAVKMEAPAETSPKIQSFPNEKKKSHFWIFLPAGLAACLLLTGILFPRLGSDYFLKHKGNQGISDPRGHESFGIFGEPLFSASETSSTPSSPSTTVDLDSFAAAPADQTPPPGLCSIYPKSAKSAHECFGLRRCKSRKTNACGWQRLDR